jgi:serine/threonine-protein kinase
LYLTEFMSVAISHFPSTSSVAPRRLVASVTHQPQFDGEVPPGYEVLYFLGRGAFSEVWKVRQEMSGRVGALKRLRPEWRENAAARQLLRNEAEVGRAVKSPHVIRVYFAETGGDDPFVVLEWIEGSPLEQVLNENELLSVRKALWIARQCAAGLADLERAGFAHGDVNPANVFVSSEGEVKLMDLGFARPLKAAGAGMLSGTPEYMAPESLCSADFHPGQRDIYSLGIMLFRMLTGRLPFTGDSTAETLQLQRSARPPLLRKLRPEVSREVADFVGRLLAKHPLRRPADVQSVIRELLRLELATLTMPGGAA